MHSRCHLLFSSLFFTTITHSTSLIVFLLLLLLLLTPVHTPSPLSTIPTAYPAWVKLAGGTMKHVLLKPKASTSSSSNITASDFVFDPAALAAAITPKTKVLLLNTPHNPLGKVFSFVELEAIAEIVRRNPQLTVVTDEVYDFLLHKDATKAPRFATLPGMWERTITLGSAGKMFSCTGWKIGWAIGPAHLTKALQQAHQW